MSTAPTLTPVAPDRRSTTLDAVRGLAVLGILVMNLPYFAMPFVAADDPSIWGGVEGADLATWYAQTILFDGKLRAIFSMLFGAGLWMQWQKAEREGNAALFGDVWSRRCIWLAAFGIVHGYLLQWPGDILFTYGVTGLFLFPFRRLGNRGTLIAAGVVLLIATVVAALGPLDRMEQAENYNAAIGVRDSGVELSASQTAAIKTWNDARAAADPNGGFVQGILATMRGGWLGSFAAQAGWTFKLETSLYYLILFWDALAMMLIGIVMMRWGIFTGAARTRSYVILVLLGYLVAVPLVGLGAHAVASTGFDPQQLGGALFLDLIYHPTRVFIGLAHVAVVVLIARSRTGAAILRPLAAVGRMAFSNYILQTVLCTTLFFGFGFGMFGHLSRSQQMLVALGVWVVALCWSPLWLRRYRFGPLEWTWRSLVHWQRQPMRRAPVE